MDVKSTFMNGELEEEVYIEQIEGFQLSKNIYYVCKLNKALYGLKQALRAWYSRMDKYLQQPGFKKGIADKNVYIKIHQRNQGIFISQTKYIREMLKRFGMEDCKPVTTSMQTNCKLRKDDDSKC
jgi:hypothetical protein